MCLEKGRCCARTAYYTKRYYTTGGECLIIETARNVRNSKLLSRL